MNTKSILFFLLGFVGGAYIVHRNKNSNTKSTSESAQGNTNLSGGHLILHPIDVGTNTEPSNVPAPDATILFPKP